MSLCNIVWSAQIWFVIGLKACQGATPANGRRNREQITASRLVYCSPDKHSIVRATILQVSDPGDNSIVPGTQPWVKAVKMFTAVTA